jgi:predicted  nucleic acid-binding Zn-ribbon protein
MMYAMLEAIEKLLALQDKDQRLRSLRQELQAIPADIATKEKLIADSASRLEQARTRAKVIEVEKKTLQVEASSKREQIARYKIQQMQTRKNEEFTALAHEIAGAEKVVSGIEDKELTLMEEAENLRPQIAAAEKIYAEEKARYDGQIAILREKSTNLKTRIADLEQLRPAAIEGIDEDLLERYERLFHNKNAQAVVALEHEVCMGCHMKVTSQTGLALRADKTIVSCPQCGRLLHLPA